MGWLGSGLLELSNFVLFWYERKGGIGCVSRFNYPTEEKRGAAHVVQEENTQVEVENICFWNTENLQKAIINCVCSDILDWRAWLKCNH